MKSRFANYIFTFFVACSIHAKTPNVVIMFMDDLGYADIGPFGAKDFPTPNLDRMAKEGRKFTDFYVTQAVCSASQVRLMTGCYNVRIGILGALGPKSNIGINPEEDTIAEICKQRDMPLPASESGIWDIIKNFFPQHGFDGTSACPTQMICGPIIQGFYTSQWKNA